jgi:hypothetical protein
MVDLMVAGNTETAHQSYTCCGCIGGQCKFHCTVGCQRKAATVCSP